MKFWELQDREAGAERRRGCPVLSWLGELAACKHV